MEKLIKQGRSLAETPTYTVASVITVLVFVCFLVERSIYRFGRWLKQTRRKALYASLEKIKEELMLLGLISLLLAQWARGISQICVNSSLFTSKFYICSESDFDLNKKLFFESSSSFPNETVIPKGLNTHTTHQCGPGREPFVSLEGLEQLHRFLFVLGITHVLYSFVAVGLAMSKIYSWRKWENQATLALDGNLQAKRIKVMKRQTTFVFHHTSHPWSRSRILIWMLCFLRQFKSSVKKSDYLALRLGFITVGLNIYFWLSFIPAILVMLVGTKLQHVVSTLALDIKEQTGPPTAAQVKPRDDLFWFRKPEILLRLIQFIIFQNAFEMATFIWSLWGLKQRSCFMKNSFMIAFRLISGVLVQFWCSYSTVPLNVIVTQMGSRCKKALVAESVRESLHSWCKRVKQKSKRESLHSHTARSVCSLESIVDDERDGITVASGTLSRSSSMESLNQVTITSSEQAEAILGASIPGQGEYSSRVAEYLSDSININASMPLTIDEEEEQNNEGITEEVKVDTLYDLFQKT
ncbi:Mlo-related protein [Corchorus capsularis]|uniref:MLO-like protein n=1 Tax=Corchorus capsularis TaxID=210143 RepID=A0A1R3HV26_COCAP|nr:Mlo-related protein [Corchorus capsularis]